MERPSKADLLAAVERKLPDVIGPGLRILFCGINPGRYSAAVGHHFARPGNRFCPALHAGGFTDRLYSPSEGRALLRLGYGLTNIADRTTAVASELDDDELVAGIRRLESKIRKHRPAWLAVLGIGAYRTAFGNPRAVLGRQPEPFAGAAVWILPNPSGLNAHHQPARLARDFAALRRAALDPTSGRPSRRRA